MSYQTLISTAELSAHLDDLNWAIIDCRFSLGDPDLGRRDYVAAHIPGAVYAHLERDLSGSIVPGKTGRHPLPSAEKLVRAFNHWGINHRVQVIAYDDSATPGGIAARLWWSLRWLGHEAVAVLDGGWARWLAEERPVRSGEERRSPRVFVPQERNERYASAEDVARMRCDPLSRVLDARSTERYLGENENLDPVAGHIPGALSAPYAENVGPDGLFRDPRALRARYELLLDGVPAERVAVYCGSGVTAAHDLLAMVHAGLGDARLYVGSWSDWITNPDNPVASSPEKDCA